MVNEPLVFEPLKFYCISEECRLSMNKASQLFVVWFANLCICFRIGGKNSGTVNSRYVELVGWLVVLGLTAL